MKNGFEEADSLSNCSFAKKLSPPNDSAGNGSVDVALKKDPNDSSGVVAVAAPVEEGRLTALVGSPSLRDGISPSLLGVSRDEGLKKDFPELLVGGFLFFCPGSVYILLDNSVLIWKAD